MSDQPEPTPTAEPTSTAGTSPTSKPSPAPQPTRAFAAAALAFVLVVVAGGSTQAGLERRIARLEEEVSAREGELALARMELHRLETILGQASRHDIPAELAMAIHDIATAEGIEPDLAYSLVRVESRFTDHAVSSAGAVGLTQVMPSTAAWLDPEALHGDLFDAETNLRLGFQYLRRLMDEYKGDVELALLAYNRGPARVDSIIDAGGDPANGYARAVLGGR